MPDWDAFSKKDAEAHLSVDALNSLWTARGRAWLDLLQAEFGDEYWVSESPNYWLLCAREKEECRSILIHCERVESKVGQFLKGIAEHVGFGKTPILIFETQELYYDYIAEYYSDGEHAFSGGVFLNKGYGHIALPWPGNSSQTFGILVHEIVHSWFMNSALPLWIEEGLTQLCEESISGHLALRYDVIKEKGLDFWNAETMQEFWRGESFNRQDEGQALSYHLAQLLLRKLFRFDDACRAFLHDASWEDSGDASMRSHFGFGLAELVTTILGDGDWAFRGFPSEETP